MSIEVGSVVEGKVTGITNFGAFVKIGEGKTGLVHISEIADEYVKDVSDYLKIDDIVKVKVINVEDGKISLSIRQVNNNQKKKKVASQKEFEAKLSRFLRDSERRQADLKRSLDAKRGGRGKKKF